MLPLKNIGIRTEMGPVGIRSEWCEKRQPMQMQVEGAGSRTIDREWLKDERDAVTYQRCVKQALLIASAMVRVADALDPLTKKEADLNPAKQQFERLTNGREKVAVRGGARQTLKKVKRDVERERSLLVKFSNKPCCAKRERGYIIDNGELKVFRNISVKSAPITKDTCSLVDCIVHEQRREPGTYQYPYFEADAKRRLEVRDPKREGLKKKPLYLYARTDKEFVAMKRAFAMSRILATENDRRSMRGAIMKATSGALQKAYTCLRLYWKEMAETGNNVRTMAARLKQGDFARGWQKLKLVYKKDQMEQQRKKEQQVWAARFMTERLGAIGLAKAKTEGEVRESVVTRIQKCFRMYREGKIFDRAYPIGNHIVSRMRQARQGMSFDVQIETLTCKEVLRLSLSDPTALEHLREFPSAMESKKFAYSEVETTPVGSMDIRTSENFQSLLFYPHEGDRRFAQLNKTEFSHFINVDRISSVVMHTCPKMGAELPRHGDDAGVWCTVHGPRLAYGKRVKDSGQEFKTSGAKDAFAVPRTLADPRVDNTDNVKWVSMTMQTGRPSVTFSAEAQHILGNPKEMKTYAVLHFLGYSFRSSWKEGSEDTYSFLEDMMSTEPRKELNAMVPISSEKDAVIALEKSELGVEIFTETADVQGTWDKGSIAGTIVVWNKDGSSPITECTGTYIKTTKKTLTITGTLKPDGHLHWSNGEVWERKGEEMETFRGDFTHPSLDSAISIVVRLATDHGTWTYRGQTSKIKVARQGERDRKLIKMSDDRATFEGVEVEPGVWQGKVELDGRKGGSFNLRKEKRDTRLVLVGSMPLVDVFDIFKNQGDQTKKESKDKKVGLFHPTEVNFKSNPLATIGLLLEAEILDWKAAFGKAPKCISPEFAGSGFATSLYTSHRGAWYDPTIGPGHFRVDHVPNFVELQLRRLHLPASQAVGTTASMTAPRSSRQSPPPQRNVESTKYRVRATIAGVSVTSRPMHRSKPTWAPIIGAQNADPDVIDFTGQRLCLPLPPGCWVSKEGGDRPAVEIEILEGEEPTGKLISYTQLVSANGKLAPPEPRPLRATLHTILEFNELMMVDQVKPLNALLNEGGGTAAIIDVMTNRTSIGGSGAVLNLDVALRDRDSVRCSAGKNGEQRDMYVGDKVMIVVESPLDYPNDRFEFKKRFCMGLYDEKQKDWKDGQCPLREPCTSSEYGRSGYDELVPKKMFKQGLIPAFCSDVTPHKYVCPFNEHQFNVEQRPGVFPRVMDSLVAQPNKSATGGPSTRAAGVAAASARLVQTLTHVNRRIPATLLATYPGGTCDVELAPEFLDEWRQQSKRKYILPGSVTSKKVMEAPFGFSSQPPAAVNVDAIPRVRTILCGVPITQIMGTHAAGFHVYNSRFMSIKDAFNAEHPQGDIDLRSEEPHKNAAFALAAGPLPAEVVPDACQYEWSLHVRSRSEYDMFQFVSMLRQTARNDQLIQATRIEAYQTQLVGAIPARPVHQIPPTAGALEIVLVEARRLRPPDFDKTWKQMESTYIQGSQLGPLREETSKGLVGTKASGDTSSLTPQRHKLTTYVEFRMLNGEDVVAVKGQKVQNSVQVDDTDSPCWAALPGLQNSGGWAFKTGMIDSKIMPNVLIDFEVKWIAYGIPSKLGAIQVPVFTDKMLSNPAEPFKSLWLPLATEKDGKVCFNPPLGEIHILARWLPPEKLQLAPGQSNLTFKAEMHKQLEPRMNGARLREKVGTVCNLEAQYAIYNPNIVRLPPAGTPRGQTMPETQAEHFTRNVEVLFNTESFLDCTNRRQELAWREFEDQLKEVEAQQDGRATEKPLADHRESWYQIIQSSKDKTDKSPEQSVLPGQTLLTQFEQLVKNGLPQSRRERFWRDITHTNREVISRSQKPSEYYKKCLSIGMPQRSDANLQLQDDAFHLGGCWESAQPPSYVFQDELLHHMRQAQNVCTALIACDEGNIDYCESILILAFFLLLPHGVKLPAFEIAYSPRWTEELQSRLQHANSDLRDVRVVDKEERKVDIDRQGASIKEDRFPITVSDETVHGLTEDAAFWVLLTLVGSTHNAAFREYYGKEQVWKDNAAMKDVSLLEAFLCHLEFDVWRHLSAVGFHPAAIFYSAFMRLYATFMPAATVIRFWDILFTATTQKSLDLSEPPGLGAPRRLLITLAYAVIRSKRSELLECQSASEVTDLILGVFGSLFDGNTVIDLIESADYILWGRNGRNSKKVLPKLAEHEEVFEYVHQATKEQNEHLRQMMHDRDLGYIRGGDRMGASTSLVGVTTLKCTDTVLPLMKTSFETVSATDDSLLVEDTERTEIWGMYRQLPLSEAVLSQSFMETTMKHFWLSFKPELPPNPYILPSSGLYQKITSGMAHTADVPHSHQVTEPYVSLNDFEVVLDREFKNWSDLAKKLWHSFTNRRDKYFRPTAKPFNPLAKAGITVDNVQFQTFMQKWITQPIPNSKTAERLSLNELYIAMIFLSKGTIGEKAAAVFQRFAHSEALGSSPPWHMTKQSSLAKSIAAKASMHDSSAAIGKTSAPDEETKRNSALRFKVMSDHIKKNDEIGNVYVPSMGMYIGASIEDAEIYTFNIWPSAELDMKQQQSRVSQGNQVTTQASQVVGELRMAMAWTPSTSGDGTGQLAIRLKSVMFFPPITNSRMNPWVVVTSVTNGREAEIKRWDPRGLVGTDQHVSMLKKGAYGGHIVFDKTMTQSGFPPNETFRQFLTHGENQGWFAHLQQWQWNDMWGKQLSVENHRFPNPASVMPPKSDNCMDMTYARYIVHCLLVRTMINVSNRQAMLIADSIFNRQGVVPGILGAILVKEADLKLIDGKPEEVALEELKANLTEKRYTDVKLEMVFEQERQMSQNGGSFNLFTPQFMESKEGKYNLQDMKIKDPYSGYPKYLVVRCVRGGDGERLTQYIKILNDGSVAPEQELTLDLPATLMCSKITKEEFVCCFLNAPLLGEALRNMGSYDHQNQQRRQLALDVTIMDPKGEEEAKMMETAFDFDQTFLLEVWDDDTFSKELLGEAWMPPLTDIGQHPRDFVLPLKMPDFTNDSDNGPSRHHRTKDGYDVNKQQKYKAEGEIYVRLCWEFPLYEMSPDGKSVVPKNPGNNNEKQVEITDRALQQEKINTGRLTITVDHGRHLRRADAKKGRDCDPIVMVWQRNDVMDHWRRKPLFRTKAIKNNRNPKWEHETHAFEIVQGEFESRFPPKDNTLFEKAAFAMKTKKQKRRIEEQRRIDAVKQGGELLKIKFGDGERHGVEIFLGDSIREFKAKLNDVIAWYQNSFSGSLEVEKYRGVEIGPQHVVTAFVAPPNLMRMGEQGLGSGPEYQRVYSMAVDDPNNWEPFVASRSFDMYSSRFGFGKPNGHPVTLRVVEATPRYKMTNLRFKEWEKERNRVLVGDMNEDEKCYGWAKYTHAADGSIEWRRAIISKALPPESSKGTTIDPSKSMYAISWLVKTEASTKPVPNALPGATLEVERSSVLLAPRLPKMDHYVHPEHQEVLEQARGLRAQGKSDYDIEAMLNKILEDRYMPGAGADKKGAGPAAKPPRITVDIIKNYMAHTT